MKAARKSNTAKPAPRLVGAGEPGRERIEFISSGVSNLGNLLHAVSILPTLHWDSSISGYKIDRDAKQKADLEAELLDQVRTVVGVSKMLGLLAFEMDTSSGCFDEGSRVDLAVMVEGLADLAEQLLDAHQRIQDATASELAAEQAAA